MRGVVVMRPSYPPTTKPATPSRQVDDALVDVFAATIPTLTFTPSVHVNYAEKLFADGACRPVLTGMLL
jgi:hypothetical protein